MALDQSTEWAGPWGLVAAPDHRRRAALEDLENLLLSVESEEKYLRRMRGPESRQREREIEHACVNSFRVAYCCGIQTWKPANRDKVNHKRHKRHKRHKNVEDRKKAPFVG
jgi:hypothetical protein